MAAGPREAWPVPAVGSEPGHWAAPQGVGGGSDDGAWLGKASEPAHTTEERALVCGVHQLHSVAPVTKGAAGSHRDHRRQETA